MNHTKQDVDVANRWEEKLRSRGIRFSEKYNKGNFDLVMGFINNQFGGVISEANLDAASRATWAALKFEPGFQMPDPRASEKEVAARIKKKNELNALGMGSHKTELDRDDAKDAKAEQNAAKRAQISQEQLEAKADFEHICSVYSVTRAGRTDHAESAERRDKLRHIIVKKGDRTLYTEMLKAANEMLHQFEVLDSKRIY
jgi:hypothetical protein